MKEATENMDDSSSTSSLVRVMVSSANSSSEECFNAEEYGGGPNRTKQTSCPASQTESERQTGGHRLICYIRYKLIISLCNLFSPDFQIKS